MSLFRKKAAPAAPVVPPQAPARAAIRLRVMRPEKFADAPLVADELIRGRTVVLNLEGMEKETLRHLLDFISGVTYALDGSIKKISGDATFIVTPSSVALADTEAAEEALGRAADTASPVAAPASPAAQDTVAAMFSSTDDEDE